MISIIVIISIFFGVIIFWIIYEIFCIYKKFNKNYYTLQMQNDFISFPITKAANFLPNLIIAIGMTTLINSSHPFNEQHSKRIFKKLLTNKNIEFVQELSLSTSYCNGE